MCVPQEVEIRGDFARYRVLILGMFPAVSCDRDHLGSKVVIKYCNLLGCYT